MRYIMKGGVWKNSEDEILKAAIMKYGLNQWSRISSLLQRKSAKQCKQRWYEWLDPSIKKTQWTRAQDQKLLQLARVFPSQWRTVAPFVGRTPTQCYQRYQKLLDIAQGKTSRQTEDLKKLRPGQIDPNPQTKPARLDPIDMDEDQKEMLAEVRVRLANTKGKKAKRKQRQKIIQQARRLAQLQKIRELEMAGVENIPTAKQIKRMRQRKDIDYNKQIPFKREVPEWTYKLQQSVKPTTLSFAETITSQTLQGKRRDVQEELQRKLDKRRMKKFKERDLKSALMLKNDFEKPVAFPIQLPQPQLDDKDLQNIKNFNITTPLNSQILTSRNPYGMTPDNKVLFAAKVNYSLNHQDMHTPISSDLDGVQGLNYLKQMQQSNKDQTMKSVSRMMSQRRSQLHNDEYSGQKIKSLFSKMKKPENQIQIQIPEEDQQQQEQNDKPMDCEQVQQIQRKKQQQILQKKLEYRSQVLKRNLPRPKYINTNFLPLVLQNKKTMAFDFGLIANSLIQQQMVKLLYSDAIDYPIQNLVFPQQPIQYKQEISIEDLESAHDLINQQMKQMKKKYSIQDYNKSKKIIKFNFQAKQVQLSKQLSEKTLIEQQLKSFIINYPQIQKQIKSTDKLQKKTKKLLAGYQKLIRDKVQKLNEQTQVLSKIRKQRAATQQLYQQEQISIKSRVQQLQRYYKLVYDSL